MAEKLYRVQKMHSYNGGSTEAAAATHYYHTLSQAEEYIRKQAPIEAKRYPDEFKRMILTVFEAQ